MSMEKWKPWNWFSKEEQERNPTALQRAGDRDYSFPLTRLHNEIDRIFDDAWRSFGLAPFGGQSSFDVLSNALLKPSIDIAEKKKAYTITVEVPGVDEDDIDLELSGNSLVITGEKRHEKEEDDENYHRVERAYGSFRRVLTLPEDAEPDKIKANYKKGVLTIDLPRKSGAGKFGSKRIEIDKAA